METDDVPMFLGSIRERALEAFCEIVHEPELTGEVSGKLVRDVVVQAMDFHGIGASEIRGCREGVDGRPDLRRYGEAVPEAQVDRRRIPSAVRGAALDELSSR